MTSLISIIVNNLSERIHEIKCKYGTMIKNVKYVKCYVNIATVSLNTQTLKMT